MELQPNLKSPDYIVLDTFTLGYPLEPFKALAWADTFPAACYLNGNGFKHYPYGPFPTMLAVGEPVTWEQQNGNWYDWLLATKSKGDWWFGYLGYDLKDQLHQLHLDESERWYFPKMSFVRVRHLVEWKDGKTLIHSPDPWKIVAEIENSAPISLPKRPCQSEEFSPTQPDEYEAAFSKIKAQIISGNVYELNYCRFFERSVAPSGLPLFLQLQQVSPTPFSAWYKCREVEIACASPERFLKKAGNVLVTQPIKGTAPRGKTRKEDDFLKNSLLHSEKERAENLMIVDLVRNDLASVSVPGSTRVEELFGIYSFQPVHQMTSTVSSVLKEKATWVDALKATFPMGSMTGAPKLEVMKQIAQLESQARGPFSGALGFIDPDQNFDFNVLIRSLFINHALNKTGYAVGSAITIDSEAKAEWIEGELKAASIRKLFQQPESDQEL